jgi:uncharacterized protein (DUF3084 family)
VQREQDLERRQPDLERQERELEQREQNLQQREQVMNLREYQAHEQQRRIRGHQAWLKFFACKTHLGDCSLSYLPNKSGPS